MLDNLDIISCLSVCIQPSQAERWTLRRAKVFPLTDLGLSGLGKRLFCTSACAVTSVTTLPAGHI